jgi:hypothetical protein
MKNQLIFDCGGRVLSALLVTADGELVPCSHEIRNVAARHVSAGVLFDPRVSEHPDFIWEDALESLSRATPLTFFQRARRIGLRRPWDAQASADALQLTGPLAVLSSAAALADRVAGAALPQIAVALLDALLEPAFAFVAERQFRSADIEPVVIVPAQTGRAARLALHKLFRRRGFPRPVILRREIAAAMALVDGPPCDCIVLDASEDDLHLHRVSMQDDAAERRFQTVSSVTLHGFGWSHWVSRIATALQTLPTGAFERALTTLLTGSPDALEARLTYGRLQQALDDAWIATESAGLPERLREIQRAELPLVFAGEIFALDAVRRVCGGTSAPDMPMLDHALHSVARAMRWVPDGDARRLVVAQSGSLRLDTFRGQAIELVAGSELPAPGEATHVETSFRVAGDSAPGTPFLMHLQWGSDTAPEGNATLCAIPLEVSRHSGDTLQMTIDLRRSRSGRRLSGMVEARAARDGIAARAQFAEELEVRR